MNTFSEQYLLFKDMHMYISGAVQNYLFKPTASCHIALALLAYAQNHKLR